MLQRKTLLTYSQRDKAVGVRYRQGGKTDFSGTGKMLYPVEKCVNSVCKNEYEYYFESSLHFW